MTSWKLSLTGHRMDHLGPFRCFWVPVFQLSSHTSGSSVHPPIFPSTEAQGREESSRNSSASWPLQALLCCSSPLLWLLKLLCRQRLPHLKFKLPNPFLSAAVYVSKEKERGEKEGRNKKTNSRINKDLTNHFNMIYKAKQTSFVRWKVH